MVVKLNEKQVLESRIRDIKRKILHQGNKEIRTIWQDHVNYLENELRGVR